jgi:hypothetical protein
MNRITKRHLLVSACAIGVVVYFLTGVLSVPETGAPSWDKELDVNAEVAAHFRDRAGDALTPEALDRLDLQAESLDGSGAREAAHDLRRMIAIYRALIEESNVFVQKGGNGLVPLRPARPARITEM